MRREEPVFKKLLEVVLHFGNFLNAGSFRGNAQGVKVSFLGEMKSTKAPNGVHQAALGKPFGAEIGSTQPSSKLTAFVLFCRPDSEL